ncbi:MAG TPA: MFS transporter [Aggregatilineaceae bacterium]|nr:MFS transporter [Aggregatilineaceae bacterium]
MHKNIRLLSWFDFSLGLRLYAPIMIIYFAQVSGSYALGMSVFAITSLSSALLEVPTGVFSDRIGRKRTLILGAAAEAAAVLFYAWGGTYLRLACGAFFQGTAWAFFSGNNNALLYDTLAASGQQDDYQHHLGRITSMDHMALALSGVTGGILAAVSLHLVMWLSLLPALVGLGISVWVQEPAVLVHPAENVAAHTRRALHLILRNRKLRLISLASILSGSIGEASYQLRAAFVQTLWPLWALGLAQTMGNVFASASFFFSGRLIRRFSEFQLLLWGGAVSQTVNTVAVVAPTVCSPALLSSTGMIYGVNMVAKDGLMQREFTSEQRATMGSLVSLAGRIAFAFFSLLQGLLADQIGVIGALLAAQGLACVPFVLYWRVFRRA